MKIYKIAQEIDSINNIKLLVKYSILLKDNITKLKVSYGNFFEEEFNGLPTLLYNINVEMEKIKLVLTHIKPYVNKKTIESLFYGMVSVYNEINKEIENQMKNSDETPYKKDNIVFKLDQVIKMISNLINLILEVFKLDAYEFEWYEQATQDEIAKEFGIKF